jgi:hypothetical protein
MKELVEGSAKWFEIKMGLCDHGLDIKKELIYSHESIVEGHVWQEKRQKWV